MQAILTIDLSACIYNWPWSKWLMTLTFDLTKYMLFKKNGHGFVMDRISKWDPPKINKQANNTYTSFITKHTI